MSGLYRQRRKNQKAFTLLELLVVLALIGLLSTIVVSSLSESRMRGRDAARVRVAQEIQKALELYRHDVGHYPAFVTAPSNDARSGTASCTNPKNRGNSGWCELMDALEPYYAGGVVDPRNVTPHFIYYDADGTAPQMYGLMVVFESSANANLANSDGGVHCTAGAGCILGILGYELGEEPRYCAQQSAPNRNWRTGAANQQCGA